jgi:hypothetical protein
LSILTSQSSGQKKEKHKILLARTSGQIRRRVFILALVVDVLVEKPRTLNVIQAGD